MGPRRAAQANHISIGKFHRMRYHPLAVVSSADSASVYTDYFNGQDFGSENNNPRLPQSQELAREILLSYRLLFGQNKTSRKAFRAFYIKSVDSSSLTEWDPLFEDLCHLDYSAALYQHINAPKQNQQYSARREFPLLGQRLVILQKYVMSRNPSDLDGLRHDRRDIRKTNNMLIS